ncbi:pyruvate, phosphate dikinase [Pseudonocardia nigra]|uniref:pyruvate, phosphate dikinase n=1 Tax=Pseudonocardia nigra TaxID=1921578 RepID=UPI001C5FF5D6|nr:pyruvate, phosphate dikinase [Pseudonocardia nigra]
MPRYVYDFHEGNRDQKELLGGKGANLAEMTNLGLPVPPGFTITTEACRAYLAHGAEPAGLRAEVDAHLAALERRMGRTLGQSDDPLLVSVRSGAKHSMPGMMETVLNVGLNDVSVAGLAAQAGDARFAWDSYRRLLQMFGRTVLGVDAEHFEHALDELIRSRGVGGDTELSAADLQELVATFQAIVREHTGRDFPQDPREQLDLAVRAVFTSWTADRAVRYRRQERIPDDLGTAVNVVAMVFGNLGPDSGTGVAFTRDPASGQSGIYGDYLPNAQGEDVVAGIRNTLSLTELERLDKACYDELLTVMNRLETHYRDLCDIEFTIERGRLWILQTRVGKRTAGAAFRIACQLVDEGLIDLPEALRRVTGHQLAQLMFPKFDERAARAAAAAPADAATQLLSRGVGASPGAAVGVAVFDSAAAVARAAAGQDVILVRRETSPDDLDGMIAARGVLTSRGGKTSHAAVVARGMGTTCVCGAESLEVDAVARTLRTSDGIVVGEGDVLSIDGTTGEVFTGAIPVAASPVVQYFEGTLDADAPQADDLVRAVHRLITFADAVSALHVRANADTAEDAVRARRFGARGIGLCRTEHMFLGERRRHIERLVIAEDEAAQQESLAALLPLQRADFEQILAAMDGLPVTVRLLDPPLHEFLPDLTELSVRVAVAEITGEVDEPDRRMLEAVRRLHERNPMLGLRGVRLGLVVPGLFVMQIRAIAEAAAARILAGGDPHVEIMIPLVGSVQELELVRADGERAIAEVAGRYGMAIDHLIGTMVELPRAALVAGELAASAEFFSFGTNDLTQMTWGFSRDDAEAAFFSLYLEKGIFGVSPFESLDVAGVGRLVRLAAAEGRQARPGLKLGVCGEHAADPDSVHFFHAAGLDYVSCSPFRVPVARLEAGRAALLAPQIEESVDAGLTRADVEAVV